jgi:hypothetical protein
MSTRLTGIVAMTLWDVNQTSSSPPGAILIGGPIAGAVLVVLRLTLIAGDVHLSG